MWQFDWAMFWSVLAALTVRGVVRGLWNMVQHWGE
jgi:hypothetical protein